MSEPDNKDLIRRIVQTQHARMDEVNEASYEDNRVRYLLRAMQLSGSAVRELRQHAENDCGEAVLRLRYFNEVYPAFPLVLACSTLAGVKVHLDPRCLLPALFRNFCRAPFVQAFDEFYQSSAPYRRGRAAGLIFRRRGLRQGLIIVDQAFPEIATCLSHHAPARGTKPATLFIYPLQELLEHLLQSGLEL